MDPSLKAPMTETGNGPHPCRSSARVIASCTGAWMLPLLLGTWLVPAPGQAGPIARRYQERKACQTFAGKLKEASANPALAQQIYQQGVLALVAKFGENPCPEIPAPLAAAPIIAPAGAPVVVRPLAPPAAAIPVVAPVAAPTVAPAGAPAAIPPAARPSAEQQQACSTFASKLSEAAASGGAAQARQVFTMGTQKLTGMFGPNPCPAVKPPV